jgi:leucyl-tRNA synthetase
VEGVHRFLNRVWRLFVADDPEGGVPRIDPSLQRADADIAILRLLHKTIRKVTEDVDGLRFNTAISQMMIFVNEMNKQEVRPVAVMESFVLLLAPFAPHLAEELWSMLGHAESLAYHPWPEFDPALTVDDEVEIVVQVNGKMRDKLMVAKGTPSAELEALARSSDTVMKHTGGKSIVKVIAVPDKLVNIVVK